MVMQFYLMWRRRGLGVFEEDLVKGMLCAGIDIIGVFLSDAMCFFLAKFGLSCQDLIPGREAHPHPDCKHPHIIPGAKAGVDFVFGTNHLNLLKRVNSDQCIGGLPFQKQTHGLRKNNFNDKKICLLPITGYDNSVVNKEQATALRVSELSDHFCDSCHCCNVLM